MAMAAEGGAEAARAARRDPGRPASLELLFDLVYVFALVSLTRALADDVTWTGLAGTVVLLLAFTLIWSLTTWSADTLDTGRRIVRWQLLGVAMASLLLAAAAPDAYEDRGLLFAVTYLVLHLGSGAAYLVANLLGGHDPAEPRRSGRIVAWEAVAGIGWIGGALVEGHTRLAFWGCAVAVEYTAAVLGWPLPRIGRSRAREWRLTGERMAERYRQFVIIALGVAILVTGTTFSQQPYTPGRAAALVVVFTTVVLMWRIYIYRAGELLTEAIARSTNPPRLTQSAAFTHLTMVAGIAGSAVTSHLVVLRPFGDTPPRWAALILGAPALFLVGRGLLDYTVFGRISRSRAAGVVLLAGAAPASSLLPPVLLALLAMAVLFLIAAANLVSTRLHTREPRPPALG
ncbi:low temperature requirement protein A [Micromonospora sp. URMC 103]|uniref:low temperature requirement protein A n=1 Tax=Micromonospora sp. URMC 103 TaxID=3423406 RepID=UPI003F19CF06